MFANFHNRFWGELLPLNIKSVQIHLAFLLRQFISILWQSIFANRLSGKIQA